MFIYILYHPRKSLTKSAIARLGFVIYDEEAEKLKRILTYGRVMNQFLAMHDSDNTIKEKEIDGTRAQRRTMLSVIDQGD